MDCVVTEVARQLVRRPLVRETTVTYTTGERHHRIGTPRRGPSVLRVGDQTLASVDAQ